MWPDAIHLWEILLIVAGAFLAGGVNAIAGGGTLISFPVLVWTGLPPVVANATNSVALWPGLGAGAFGFRRELASVDRRLLWLTVPSLLGGAVGAVLLVSLPSSLFARIVPWLVLAASLVLVLNGPVSRLSKVIEGRRAWWATAVGSQLAVATYAGYFGAGFGILVLAALGPLGLRDLHERNGLKNVFGFCAKGTAVVYLGMAGKIAWLVAAVMVGATIGGGLAGARSAHRIGQERVRRVVVIMGIVLALSLLLRL